MSTVFVSPIVDVFIDDVFNGDSFDISFEDIRNEQIIDISFDGVLIGTNKFPRYTGEYHFAPTHEE